MAVREGGGLGNGEPQSWMNDLEGEQKTAVADLRMDDRQSAWRRPSRKEQPAPENLQEIAVAAEHQCALPHLDRQRHADPVADILLETGAAGEPLGRMDDLRKAAAAGVEAGARPSGPRPALGRRDRRT